jgi:tetratricopeptide (TPR) repeat protein
MYASVLVIALVASGVATPDGHDPRADSRLCERAVDKRSGALEEIAVALRDPAIQPGRAAFLRGCEWWGKGKDGPAAAEFEKASRAEPNSAWYHFWLGRVYGTQTQGASLFRQPGLARRTRAHLEKAVALDPDLIEGRDGLIQYYLLAPAIAGGSKEKAKEEADEIARRNPYAGALAHGRIARHVKDTASMVRVFESMVEQYPDSTAPYLQLGAILIARKDWTRAWALSDRLCAAHPDYRYAFYWTGVLASESGERLDLGERYLREYLAHPPGPNEPSHAAAHWRLGRILERSADRDGARGHYQEALKLDPKFKPAQESLATLR